jgi:hypothetical protein
MPEPRARGHEQALQHFATDFMRWAGKHLDRALAAFAGRS